MGCDASSALNDRRPPSLRAVCRGLGLDPSAERLGRAASIAAGEPWDLGEVDGDKTSYAGPNIAFNRQTEWHGVKKPRKLRSPIWHVPIPVRNVELIGRP